MSYQWLARNAEPEPKLGLGNGDSRRSPSYLTNLPNREGHSLYEATLKYEKMGTVDALRPHC